MSNNKRPHSSPSQEAIDAMIKQGFDPRMLEHQAQLAARNTIANTMHTHQMHPMMNYVVPPGPQVVSHRTSALLSHMPPPPQHFMLHNWHPSNPPNSTNFAGSNNNIINSNNNKNNTNNTTQSKSTADNNSSAQAPQIDPEFYDKLVKMLGKEGADEIVKESLNETFMEAGKRTNIQKGGDSKSSTSEKGKSSISSNKEKNDVVLVDDGNSSPGDAKKSGEQRSTTAQIKDPKKAYDVQLKEFAMQFSPLKTTTGSASSGDGSGGDSKKRKLSAAELLAASAPKHQYQQRTPFSMNHNVYPMGYAAQGQSLSIPAVNNNTFTFNPSLPPPTVKLSDGDDPPGLDQFRADPDFCSLILDAAEEYQSVNQAAKKHMKSVGGLFVHGLLNINDEMLNIPLRDDANGSVKAYVKNVICPYFNVPSNLPERAGKWEAYVHISSDNINEFARNVVYQRRKAMKSAVELAYYEVMNNDERRGSLYPDAGSGNNKQSGEMQDDHPSKTDSKEKKLAIDLERSEKTLIETIAKHKKEISALKEQHLKETEECEANYTEFVAKLIAKHRKEKEEMQRVHTTFVESYVESSLDALRELNDKSPK